LKKTIQEGGAKLGGLMPPFEDKLSDKDIDAAIAYFQSKWPDDVYQKWADRFLTSGNPPVIAEAKKSTEAQSSENPMTNLLRLRLGSKAVSDPIKTPVDGIYQTQFGSQYGYLSQDGRYIFIGSMVDLKTGTNLTNLAKGKTAITELNRVALDDKVIFPAKGEEKAVLNVFTDTACPYCKKLHEQVGKLQEAGISIHYLPYPRGGRQGPGYQSLKQVWCAKDKPEAMGIAKGLDIGDLPSGDCAKGKFVDEGYALGNRVGLKGTPSLFKSNGENIEGFVPYQELIPMVLNN
jgi:thiol:disulfide interchange protein DsbC